MRAKEADAWRGQRQPLSLQPPPWLTSCHDTIVIASSCLFSHVMDGLVHGTLPTGLHSEHPPTPWEGLCLTSCSGLNLSLQGGHTPESGLGSPFGRRERNRPPFPLLTAVPYDCTVRQASLLIHSPYPGSPCDPQPHLGRRDHWPLIRRCRHGRQLPLLSDTYCGSLGAMSHRTKKTAMIITEIGVYKVFTTTLYNKPSTYVS